jgi:two-component system, NarL family, sensor kinase
LSDEPVDRLIAAEQDERRRLALFLHDGPVQQLSGIALMLDGALHSIADGRTDDAREIIGTALERHRATIRELRDLSFALEPVVLRDRGCAAAIRALADQTSDSLGIRFQLDVDTADAFGETAQVSLYTVVRELVEQSIRRGPPTLICVDIQRTDDGGAVATLLDDAEPERRRRTHEAIEERVEQLHGTLTIEPGDDGGTRIRLTLPSYAAQR